MHSLGLFLLRDRSHLRLNVYLGPMFKGFEFCLPARQDCPQAELKDLKAMARLKMDAQVIALALGRHVASVKKKRELKLVLRKR